MQIKLLDVIIAEEALKRLFSCHPPEAKDAHRLVKVMREVLPIQKDYRAVQRGMLEKYGAVPDPEKENRFLFAQTDDDGEIVRDENKEIVRNDEAAKGYTEEHRELVETEMVGVDQFVTLEFFNRIELKPPISSLEMSNLWWLIEELHELGDGRKDHKEEEVDD